MKIFSSHPDPCVTNGPASDKTSLVQYFGQQFKALFSIAYSLATTYRVDPHNMITANLALCTPLRPGEERPPAPTPEQAANTIVQAIRQQIAEKAYRRFFSQNRKYAGHYEPGQSTTAHLQAQSRKHLAAVTQRLGVLTPKEQAFFDKVAASPWAFQHTSKFNLEQNGHLKLYSSRRLEEEGKLIKSSTPPSDQDLVFLSVDFNAKHVMDESAQEKVIQHDYGNKVYVLQEDQALLKQGFMTLTDSMLNLVAPYRSWDNYPERYQQRVAEAKDEVVRTMGFGDENPCYTFRDMKSAVALHAIEFLRQSKDAGFVKFVLEEADLAGTDLDHILNSILDCEFHLPRSVVTSHYSTFTLRGQTVMNESMQSKAMAEAALSKHTLPLIPSLDKQELQLLVEVHFSYPSDTVNPDSRENAEFLETVISQGLIDPLDQSLLKALIRNENIRLLEVLFKHGANETALKKPDRELLAKLRHAGASLQTIIMTADSHALDRYIGDDLDDMTKALAKILETNTTALIDPLVTKWQLNAESLMKMMRNIQFYRAVDRLTKPQHAPMLDKLLSSGLIDPNKPLRFYDDAPTPLEEAIQLGNDKTVKILIKHGADSSKLPKDEHKKYIFLQKHGAFLDNLLKRTDLTALRKCLTDKETAIQVLGQALARNNSEIVGMVLAACAANDWHISAQDYAPATTEALDMKACVAFLNSGYAKPAWFGRLIPPALLEEALHVGLRPLASRFH